jgi:hypothetical protein
MKLELNLLELNELYLATSRLVEQNQKHLDELGKNVSSINYFKTQLDSSKVLRDKIQTALYDEANRLDKIIADDEPEYDSAGFTEDDRIVNGQYKVISNENK